MSSLFSRVILPSSLCCTGSSYRPVCVVQGHPTFQSVLYRVIVPSSLCCTGSSYRPVCVVQGHPTVQSVLYRVILPSSSTATVASSTRCLVSGCQRSTVSPRLRGVRHLAHCRLVHCHCHWDGNTGLSQSRSSRRLEVFYENEVDEFVPGDLGGSDRRYIGRVEWQPLLWIFETCIRSWWRSNWQSWGGWHMSKSWRC